MKYTSHVAAHTYDVRSSHYQEILPMPSTQPSPSATRSGRQIAPQPAEQHNAEGGRKKKLRPFVRAESRTVHPYSMRHELEGALIEEKE